MAKRKNEIPEEEVPEEEPQVDSESEDGIDVDTTGWDSDRSLPPGEYPAILLEVEKGKSQAGNNMLIWKFCLVECPHAGQEFRTYTVLNDSNAWKLGEVLRATGLGKLGGRLRFKYDDYVNIRVLLRLKNEWFEGEKRSSIGKVLAWPDGIGTKWVGATPTPDSAPRRESSIGAPDDSDEDLPF